MRKRKGYILLAVLGIAAVVTALGLSFVESHSTAMPESVNRYGSMRALYLAESGVSVAAHFLMYPPTTVAFDQYYTGGNNIAVDASTDYTNVSVVRSDGWTPAKTDPSLFRISAVGVALDSDGSVRGKRQVTAEVIVPEAGKWRIPYACFCTSTSTVPARMNIYGDVHANGLLTGALGSFCNGKVSATGTALWLGVGPPTSVVSLAAAYTGPAGTSAKYKSYTIRGKTYTALTIADNDITQADADALNAVTLTATNPGRVIVYEGGDIRINANVNLLGTLVIPNGSTQIRGAGPHQITAIEGFPALVMGGGLEVYDNDANVTIIGSIITQTAINLTNKNRCNVNVTGSVVSLTPARNIATDSVVRVNWDQNKSWFWDVESTPTPQPMTILSWKEN